MKKSPGRRRADVRHLYGKVYGPYIIKGAAPVDCNGNTMVAAECVVCGSGRAIVASRVKRLCAKRCPKCPPPRNKRREKVAAITAAGMGCTTKALTRFAALTGFREADWA